MINEMILRFPWIFNHRQSEFLLVPWGIGHFSNEEIDQAVRLTFDRSPYAVTREMIQQVAHRGIQPDEWDLIFSSTVPVALI